VEGNREVSLRYRGGFTVTQMKRMLQGPSLARAPSKTLAGAIEMYKFPEILRAHVLNKLDKGFPTLDRSPKNLHGITNNEL
jgi:hypothetical protein